MSYVPRICARLTRYNVITHNVFAIQINNILSGLQQWSLNLSGYVFIGKLRNIQEYTYGAFGDL